MPTVSFKKFVFIPAATFFVISCTPTHNVRGNFVKDYQLERVQPGEDTQSDILREFGSPTTKDPFNDNIWYYIGQETEKKGILDPKIIDERVITVTFNTEGRVEHVEDISGNREDIPFVRYETPTSGHNITVLQQLLGNIGRFNTAGADADQ